MSYIVYGNHDERTLAQMDRCMKFGSAVRGVLCADGHLGYAHPIGGVIGYTDHISISGVGYDIACGNLAVRLDTRYADIKDHTSTILGDISRVISFGVGRVNCEKVEHALFDNSELWDRADVSDLRQLAEHQLGTVGSGNHYVDLFEDEEGFVWIGVHFGSRGLGHKITSKYLAALGAKDEMEGDPTLIELGTEMADGYMAGLELAGQYAYAGREWVVEKVRQLVGGAVNFTVHNHHNWAWFENHLTPDGHQDMWVVRKGATPAFPGQYGFVGGSMGDNAVILRGIEGDVSRKSMYSTVHGAGRVMSRTEARGRYKRNPITKRKERLPGKVDFTEWQQWIGERGVTLIGGDLDEAPQAYRRLPDVLAEHAETIEVVHTLRPFGVIMGGANDFDPYKD